MFFSNIFPWMGKDAGLATAAPAAAPVVPALLTPPPPVVVLPSSQPQEGRKKRCRRISTPSLIDRQDIDDDFIRPVKIFRGEVRKILIKEPKKTKKSPSLQSLPEDLVAHALSFVCGTEDRFALQCTSKKFKRITDSDKMKCAVEVGGANTSSGIVLETDTPALAAAKLAPYAMAGNLEAVYMLGIIKSYCDCDVESGISLLRKAAARGYVRASYALGLVLRDAQPKLAAAYMKTAAEAQYLPALQETLPAREMKLKHGEPCAEELRRHLDHLCLNRLLARHYCSSDNLKYVNTSHCWNPLCGRWAFKATTVPQTDRVSRMKMCSRCCRAKYCSKLCQVYDWRSGRHKMECQFL